MIKTHGMALERQVKMGAMLDSGHLATIDSEPNDLKLINLFPFTISLPLQNDFLYI